MRRSSSIAAISGAPRACVSVFSPLVALLPLRGLLRRGAAGAADFFDEPQPDTVLRVMALVLVFRGLAMMPRALLERQMRFGPITAIELGAGIAQAATAIGLAFAGAGVWSLVAGQLAFGGSWQRSSPGRSRPIRPSPFEARRGTLRELVALRAPRRRCQPPQLRARERRGHRRRPRPRCDCARLLLDRESPRVRAGRASSETSSAEECSPRSRV